MLLISQRGVHFINLLSLVSLITTSVRERNSLGGSIYHLKYASEDMMKNSRFMMLDRTNLCSGFVLGSDETNVLDTSKCLVEVHIKLFLQILRSFSWGLQLQHLLKKKLGWS